MTVPPGEMRHGGGRNTVLIDGHAHATTDDFDRYPTRPDVDQATLQRVNDHLFTATDLVAQMDECGVDHAVLLQRNSIYGVDNSYVVDAGAEHPERISAVIGIDAVRIPQGELDDWLARGARGFRLSSNMSGIASDTADRYTGWLDSPEAERIWRAAADRHLPVCVYLSPVNRTVGIEALGGVASRFGDVEILIDHLANFTFAAADPDMGIDVLSPLDHPNVSLKISPLNFEELAAGGIDPAIFVRRLCDVFGSTRVTFGSDVTNTAGAYDILIDKGRYATRLLSERERDAFLGGNLARAFSLGG